MKICPTCNSEYERIGMHWHHNPDHRYSFTDEQLEIITGLVMGDGCIEKTSKNPSLYVEMTNKSYLDYLHTRFRVLSNGVCIKRTAKENALRSKSLGMNRNAKTKNYSDTYLFRTVNHPELKSFKDWYSSGSKRYPNNLKLTPLITKHWYCGDGYYDTHGGNRNISIGCTNESDNKENVEKLFEDIGLVVSNWKESYSNTDRYTEHENVSLYLDVKNTQKLFDYMGPPPEGFEYKWPEEYR